MESAPGQGGGCAEAKTVLEKANEEKGREEKAEGDGEEESPDEWTVLAETYTSSLVPSFAPIYKAIANDVTLVYRDRARCATTTRILDFGCGPGEPSLTIVTDPLLVGSDAEVVGVDSTKPMLDIAKQRLLELVPPKVQDRVSFHHVRRDIAMSDFFPKDESAFDVVVSSFVLHYVAFERRIELLTRFLELAKDVLLVTWGRQSHVAFLRAIKTFGAWKQQQGDDEKKDICEVVAQEEDNGQVESPCGSFTMAREATVQGLVDKTDNALLLQCETKTINIAFPNVRALLNFLPIPGIGTDEDCRAMMKLLVHWNETREGQVILQNDVVIDKELVFPTEVVFSRICRNTNSKKRKAT